MSLKKRRRLTNQELEQHYFKQFQKVYSLPAGEVIAGDKPDVTIIGARRIGIEITDFYLEEGDLTCSEQQQSTLREFVVCEAHRLYMKSGGKNVEFSIGFNKAWPIANKRALAKAIASFAPAVDGRANGQILKGEYAHIPQLDSLSYMPGSCNTVMSRFQDSLTERQTLHENVFERVIVYKPRFEHVVDIVSEASHQNENRAARTELLPP